MATMRSNLALQATATANEISKAIQREVVAPSVGQQTTPLVSASVASRSNIIVAGSSQKATTLMKEGISQDTQKQRGQARECLSLDVMEQEIGQRVVARNVACLRKTLFSVSGIPVVLVGKVDGRLETSGEVVEAKERRNRLFGQVVGYERIQMHCYMHLTDTRRGILRERHNASAKNHFVDFDDMLWTSALEKLKEFVLARLEPYAVPHA